MVDKGKGKLEADFPKYHANRVTNLGQRSRDASEILKENRYNIGGKIGQGSFGVVHKCTEQVIGKAYACKIMSTRIMCDPKMAKREMGIMKGLPPHPNIVGCKDGFDDKNVFVLLVELCEGGSLKSHMKKKRPSEPEAVMRDLRAGITPYTAS